MIPAHGRTRSAGWVFPAPRLRSWSPSSSPTHSLRTTSPAPGSCGALDATRPLTVIVAAPGSGKTVLLTEWASALGSSSRWLSLDDDDNDPVRFWDHVLASLDLPLPATVATGRGRVRSRRQPARRSDRSPVVLLVDQVHAAGPT